MKIARSNSLWELSRIYDAALMIVSDVFIVDENQLISKRQESHFVSEARFAIYALLNHIAKIPKKTIAMLTGRDRKGIQYGIEVFEMKRAEKPYYSECYATCERLFKAIL